MIGFGQRTGDLSVYQNTLQGWLADSAFWTDMATYVSDWSQEVYGDLRAHAVPGSATSVRREYLNDYLQHKLVLASAGPSEIEPARAFLREALQPARERGVAARDGLGLDDGSGRADGCVPLGAGERAPLLQRDVRSAARPLGLRLGAAQHDRHPERRLRSADGAAARPPRRSPCATRATSSSRRIPEAARAGRARRSAPSTSLEARHNEAWRSFRAWALSTLTISGAPATLAAGVASPPLQLALASAVSRPLNVTLRSSSPAGAFSTTAAGPWTTTLTIPVAAGSGVVFHYRDTRAGKATLTASAPGTTAATSELTVVAGAAARIAVTPASREVRARGETRFTATATDSFGNAARVGVTWSVTPATLGTFVRGPEGTVTFRAGRVLGDGIRHRDGRRLAGRVGGRRRATGLAPPRPGDVPPDRARRAGDPSRRSTGRADRSRAPRSRS